MGKKAAIIVGILVILCSAIGLFVHTQKDSIIRELVEAEIADATGFGVEIGTVESSLKDCSVILTGLRLMNPEGFVEREAFDVPRVYAEATWKTLLGFDQHLKKLHITVNRMVFVRNADATTNMDMLIGKDLDQAVLRPRATTLFPVAAIGMQAQPVSPKGAEDLTIEELKIHVGKVKVVDYILGQSDQPMTINYTIDEERLYLDVTDLEQVMKDMSVSLAMNSLSKNLGGLFSPDAIGKLNDTAPQLMEGLMQFLGEGSQGGGDGQADDGNSLQDALKSLLQ